MARGWESKSVESQIESANSEEHHAATDSPSAAELQLIREKEGLIMSRTRVVREMEASHNPRYRKILGKALADLDARLARFDLHRAAHGS